MLVDDYKELLHEDFLNFLEEKSILIVGATGMIGAYFAKSILEVKRRYNRKIEVSLFKFFNWISSNFISPTYSFPGNKSCPGFMRWKVSVVSALTAIESTHPVSVCTPEGISMDMTFDLALFMLRKRLFNSSAIGRFKPIPKILSIIISKLLILTFCFIILRIFNTNVVNFYTAY